MVEKGNGVIIDFNSLVVFAKDTEINFVEVTKNQKIVFDVPIDVGCRQTDSVVWLNLSERIKIRVGGNSDLWVDNLERFAEDKSITANFRLNGSAEFVLDTVGESEYISIQTDGADLEIKSKEFYIITDKNSTRVECYEGSIVLTDSITLKQTILKSGNSAEIYGSNGDKNNVIRIYPLKEWMISLHKERINN